MTARGIESLSKRLQQLCDYADRGCPQVKRITLHCTRAEALGAGVTEVDGRLVYRGREINLIPPRKL